MGAISRGSVAVTGALTTVFVARLLGADGTGAFAVALATINVLTVVTTLGVEHGVAYYVSNRRWSARAAFGATQQVALVSGLVGAALGLLFSTLVPGPFTELTTAEVALGCFALPFSLSWFYGSYVALADDVYEGFVLPPAVQSATAMLLVIVLGLAAGVAGAVLGLLLSHAAASLLTLWFGGRRLGDRDETDDLPTIRHLDRAVRFGVKSYAANALQVLNYRVDVLLLAAVAPAAAVGSYSVAAGVTTLLWLLPQAVSDVLFPRVASLGGVDDAEHRRMVETKSLRHVVLVAAGGAIGLAAGMWLLVVPIYGSEFRDAVTLGLIRLPGVALLGVAGVLSATYVGRGFPQYGLYSALVVTPTTMILYALIIPGLGAEGAALASTLSFTLSFVLALAFYRRAVGEPVLHRLVPTWSEAQDYLALWPQVRARLRAPRGGAS